MKHVVSGALVFAVALFAAGCGNEKTAEAPASTPKASEPVKASAAATSTPAAAQSTGVAECDSYLAALEKFMNCSKVPQAARDAQKQSAQAMRNSWASWGTMPADARAAAQAAAKTSCGTALTSLKQAASASGCPVE